MHPVNTAARPARLTLLLALCAAGAADAAQRSLAEIMSESFEQSTAQPRGAEGAAAGDAPVAVVQTPAPVRVHPVPDMAEPSPATSLEGEVEAAVQTLDESLEHAIDKFHEMVIAPERLQPVPPTDPTMGCNELYEETTRLVALGERYRPAYAEDPRNIAIGAAGFVFAPAFYLYGATAYGSWYESKHRKTAKQRVTELRRLMADRRCFARD